MNDRPLRGVGQEVGDERPQSADERPLTTPPTHPSERPLPADERPLVSEPFHTADLPPTPQRDRRLPAHLWLECPPHLLALGADFGVELVAYKRLLGTRWLLWRAGPAVHDHARYGAVDLHAIDDPARFFTYRLQPDGSGRGIGPDGIEHTRFRTWKESLRDN